MTPEYRNYRAAKRKHLKLVEAYERNKQLRKHLFTLAGKALMKRNKAFQIWMKAK